MRREEHYLSTQSYLNNIAWQYLERGLLVPDRLLEPCDVLLLVVDLLLRLGQVRLQLVVRVCGLLRQFTFDDRSFERLSLLFPVSQAVE